MQYFYLKKRKIAVISPKIKLLFAYIVLFAELQLSVSQQVNVKPLPLFGQEMAHDLVMLVTPRRVTDVVRQYLFTKGKQGDGRNNAAFCMPEPL